MISLARSAASRNTTDRFPNLLQIRRISVQEIEGSVGAVVDGANRLGNFVGNRSRELSHRRNAIGMRQLFLHLLQASAARLRSVTSRTTESTSF